MGFSIFRTVFIAVNGVIFSSYFVAAKPVEQVLWDNALAAYEVTQQTLVNSFKIEDVSRILSTECNMAWTNQHEVAALEAQSQSANQDYGLELRAGYTSRNIEHSLDNDDGSTYMELSWDILRNGYRENQYKATDYRRQAAIKTLTGKLKKHELNYQCRRYNLAKHFSGIEAHLNAIKLEFMESIYRVEKEAYFLGASYLDDLLISEEDILLARQSLERLHSDSIWQDSMDTLVNPPSINVDLPALLTQIRENKDFIEIRRLERLRIKDQYQREDSLLEGSRFRLFLRKEFDLARNNSDELVAGLRFQLPITFGQAHSQTEARLNQLENDLNHEQWEVATRTRSAYQSLQEQLERTTKQQYRVLRTNEKMRRVLSYASLNKALDIAAVNVRLKNYLDAAIELIQAKEELYRRVNEMFLVSRVDYDSRFIKINSLNETQHRSRSGQRSVYIWSEQFNQYSNQELFLLLQTKAIKHAVISSSNKVKQAKFFQFIKEADQHGLQVSQLLGESSWALTGNHERALAAIEVRTQYGNSIHLDIEPHSLTEYKENKLIVLNQYVALIESIRLQHPKLHLAISIPHHWPAEIMQSLNDYVDQVFLMAYESTDLEQVSVRVKQALVSIPMAKLVIALRKEEFTNELQLENAIEFLSQSTGVTQFAVHKLDIFTQE
ncbi:hypothetical protein [Rheinheimera sp. MMS21-TC3]|uniref:hypothetical protein n=1 Tax=Rheinheimera sp. MMS21-TC3 TaxID=3072790 RepID=UPI0028C4B499|nr:hypothetical protein [Rheinheimera sp. MMS21-TC3]WNO59648.1 hypothetical protein RDV63_01415 [Rheinheimera sp. MMS21-TC3]